MSRSGSMEALLSHANAKASDLGPRPVAPTREQVAIEMMVQALRTIGQSESIFQETRAMRQIALRALDQASRWIVLPET